MGIYVSIRYRDYVGIMFPYSLQQPVSLTYIRLLGALEL